MLLSACGEKVAPIKVELSQFSYPQLPYLIYNKVTVTTISDNDEIIIRGITVNKGNCKSIRTPFKERTLSYGQYVEDVFITPEGTTCNVLQTTVDTNKGSWSFDFKR